MQLTYALAPGIIALLYFSPFDWAIAFSGNFYLGTFI